MPRQMRFETDSLNVEIWPEGLDSQPAPARVVSLAPGVICLATAAPPSPGTRFVAKFSIQGEFPIVAGCQARWRLERGAQEYWVSATFLTLNDRDREILLAAWRPDSASSGAGAAPARTLSAAP